MAYCPNCGELIDVNAIECARCGALFGVNAAWRPIAAPASEFGLADSAGGCSRLARAWPFVPVLGLVLSLAIGSKTVSFAFAIYLFMFPGYLIWCVVGIFIAANRTKADRVAIWLNGGAAAITLMLPAARL
jgi:hypothetical protein